MWVFFRVQGFVGIFVASWCYLLEGVHRVCWTCLACHKMPSLPKHVSIGGVNIAAEYTSYHAKKDIYGSWSTCYFNLDWIQFYIKSFRFSINMKYDRISIASWCRLYIEGCIGYIRLDLHTPYHGQMRLPTMSRKTYLGFCWKHRFPCHAKRGVYRCLWPASK